LPVDTNIVIFNLTDKYTAAAFEEALKPYNIKLAAFGKQTIRFVTHLDFTDDMLTEVLNVLKNCRMFFVKSYNVDIIKMPSH